MSILVYIEHVEGAVKKTSLEAISYAHAMGQQSGNTGEVIALALGEIDSSALEQAGTAGAAKVIHVNDPRLSAGIIMAHAEAIAKIFNQLGTNRLVLAKSSLGDAVAARLAVKLNAALVSNVVDLPQGEGNIKVRRSIYTGKAFADTQVKSENIILAVKKNAVDLKTDGSPAAVETISLEIAEENFSTKILSSDKATGEIALPEADIVVSGGRGMKGPENWHLLEELAQTLGAATGCSKPVSDIGWRPHHEHVGQTGVKVAPTLYIAVGISGAIQHLAGVNSSKNIVVINKDADAPFFKAADYGVVGDAFEVLPKLTEAVKAIK
jgi:electron transfer flavoprotein alpha subunit